MIPHTAVACLAFDNLDDLSSAPNVLRIQDVEHFTNLCLDNLAFLFPFLVFFYPLQVILL